MIEEKTIKENLVKLSFLSEENDVELFSAEISQAQFEFLANKAEELNISIEELITSILEKELE